MHIDTVTAPEDDAVDQNDLRYLSEDLVDLPGDGLCLWEGYILADTPDEAREKIEAAY